MNWARLKFTIFVVVFAIVIIAMICVNIFFTQPFLDDKICVSKGYDKGLERQLRNESLWIKCFRNNDTMSEWVEW